MSVHCDTRDLFAPALMVIPLPASDSLLPLALGFVGPSHGGQGPGQRDATECDHDWECLFSLLRHGLEDTLRLVEDENHGTR